MHVYIYDSFLNQKKYDNILTRVETRITDLGLNGKICRLGAMKSIKDMVEGELKRGATTIIAVGNDKTVSQVVNTMAPLNSTTPLGIIPIGRRENIISAALGIETAEEACETLSARRIEKLDLGTANNYYFLAGATIGGKGTILEIKSYSVEIMEEGEIKIINLPPSENFPANPQDGVLDLYIQTVGKKKFLFGKEKAAGQSVFPLKKLSVMNIKNQPLILDGTITVNTPIEIGVEKQRLNVIVGKGRKF